ncbi:MAG: 4Fe-4S dicluster domain-containing protein [Ruminococcaceae bacterium]|nr:4Fe-4S dicluster domain-containing protein [Oscillospiraceae bacterium]
MIYNDFKGLSLSMLGMGGMRFPTNPDGTVDLEATQKLFDLCIERGVNYFDTAWFYHNGMSEEAVGKLLRRYPRDSYYLATKMPWYDFEGRAGMEALFEKQFERTGMEYFDFYLIHNVSDMTYPVYTDPALRIPEFLAEQHKKGRFRHFGISTHASNPTLEKFLNTYGELFEFCQMQLNWLDWTLQDAKGKVDLLRERGLPIWVMEPLRGGRLASLAPEDEAVLKALRPDESIGAWGFRFLQSIPGVTLVLSGMQTAEIIEDNTRTFDERKPLTPTEWDALMGIADRLLAKKTLTCTECKYCMSECPQGLAIPKLLSVYSNTCLMGTAPDRARLAKKFGEEGLPSACVGCRACEAKCPQEIKISEILADFAKNLK